MKREEKLSLLQRCIRWREANIKEKQFILILSFLVGIFTAIAALFLKFLIHQIQNFLTDNFNATSAMELPRFYMRYRVVKDASNGIISGRLRLPVLSRSASVDRLERRPRLF